MIYMLSWRGRGVVAFLGIWVAVAFMLLGLPKGEEAAFFTFSLGWVVVGVACFILGMMWNKGGDNVHRFCGVPLQTWGIIYFVIGLMLVKPAYQGMQMAASVAAHRRALPAGR